jgi:hypothetical protein
MESYWFWADEIGADVLVLLIGVGTLAAVGAVVHACIKLFCREVD